MDDIINVSNAAEAPVSNASIPVNNPGIDVAAGTGGLASPTGNEAIANEMGGTKAAGWPTGQTSPIEPQNPVTIEQQSTDPI